MHQSSAQVLYCLQKYRQWIDAGNSHITTICWDGILIDGHNHEPRPARADALGDTTLDKITGTSLDTGVEMDAMHAAMAKCPRAERRTGELLKDLPRTPSGAERNPSGRAGKEPVPNDADQVIKTPSPYAKALAETGISTQTASRYQALANVPTAVFESALRSHDVGVALHHPATLQPAKGVAFETTPLHVLVDCASDAANWRKSTKTLYWWLHSGYTDSSNKKAQPCELG